MDSERRLDIYALTLDQAELLLDLLNKISDDIWIAHGEAITRRHQNEQVYCTEQQSSLDLDDDPEI